MPPPIVLPTATAFSTVTGPTCVMPAGTPPELRNQPRGTILLLTGRGEFIEKYATEVVGELLGRGFAVIALDWRGQGLSYRPLADHEKGHIDSFDTYLADLKLFLQSVVAPEAPRPSSPSAIPWAATSCCGILPRPAPNRSRPASSCHR